MRPIDAQYCRVCGCPFPLGRGSCDYRCPVCRARRRYWTAAQLGTRAQIYVTARDSEFHGESGVGERVSTPEDGWRVRLLSGGKPLFFRAAAVSVDYEIRTPLEARKPYLTLPGRNGRESTGGKSRTGTNPARQTAQDAPEGPRTR